MAVIYWNSYLFWNCHLRGSLQYYGCDVLKPPPPPLIFIAFGEKVQYMMAAMYLTSCYFQIHWRGAKKYYGRNIFTPPPPDDFTAIAEGIHNIMTAIYWTPTYFKFSLEREFKILWPRYIDLPFKISHWVYNNMAGSICRSLNNLNLLSNSKLEKN